MKASKSPAVVLFLATLTRGYDVDFILRSNVPEEWRNGGGQNDPVLVSAWEMSSRLCKQYYSIPGFCDALIQAVTEANDDEVLMAIPAKLPSYDQTNDNFSAAFTTILEQSQVTSPLPKDLDVDPRTAWRIISQTEEAQKLKEKLVLDTIFDIGYLKASNQNLTTIESLFFPAGELSLFSNLKPYLHTWIQDIVAQPWTDLRDFVHEFHGKYDAFIEKVAAEDKASSGALKTLVSLAAGKEAYFKPQGSAATFFPLYIMWSSMPISIYRAVLCSERIKKLISAEDLKLVQDAYHRLVNDVVTHAASVEVTYNLWFLMNSKYLSAEEITNHFQLRIGFDYALWAGRSRDACGYYVIEAKTQATYSAIPLFNGDIVDNAGEGRERLMYDFFVSAMTYTLPNRRLAQITIQRNFWDGNGNSFNAIEMKYADGTSQKYGIIDPSTPVTWNLVAKNKLYKLRGLRYEGDTQTDNLEHTCSGNVTQKYRERWCYNKFKTSAGIDSKWESWELGKSFTSTDVIVPDGHTRLLNGFIGFPSGSNEAQLNECSYSRQYAIVLRPEGHTPLLDNLLAIFRSDSSGYADLESNQLSIF